MLACCHCSVHETVYMTLYVIILNMKVFHNIKKKCFNETEEINVLHTRWNTNEHTIENIFGKIIVYITDDFNVHNDTKIPDILHLI